MKKLSHALGAGLFAACLVAPVAFIPAMAQQTPAPKPTPNPGTEAALRKLIADTIAGTPDYASMTPSMADATRTQLPRLQADFKAQGAIKSIEFKGQGPQGRDLYDVIFENGMLTFNIGLDANGKMAAGVRMAGPAAGPRPAAAPSVRMDDAALGVFVKAEMERLDYSGAVLVARDGKAVVSAVRGLADREKNTASTLDTRFRVGSMNKMMTATAIMQLVQAGKVKLDAPLGQYLKDYPSKDFAKSVTVHHLLTHTAGAGDIFGPKFNEKRLELKGLKDYVALYGERAGEFTPGDNWRYANYGFILLGRIVEEVSGQSYYDYVRDHIFKPAGMTRTGFEPEDQAVENRAKGYTLQGTTYASNAGSLPYRGMSAGGGYSTVGDFLAFATALTSHKLLDAKHYQMMTTRKVSNGYAYGFNDFSTPDMRQAGHSGGAPGMNGDLRILGDGKAVIVTLSNVSPPGLASLVSQEIVERLKIAKADGAPARLGVGPAGLPATSEDVRQAAFKTADKDNDGKLDKAAYRSVLGTLGFADQFDPYWTQRDVNKDGFISAQEFSAPIGQPRQ